MKRIIIPNVETYLAAIPAEIKQTRDARYAHRLEVVRFVLKGHSPGEAAAFFNHSPRSIHNWLHRLADQGLHGLDDVPPPGRPSRLSEQTREQLRQDLKHSPRELEYDQNLWDGILLSHHLDQKYSVALSVRSCQLRLQQLDFSLQRPRHQACEADPAQQAVFKKISTANARPQRSAMVRG